MKEASMNNKISLIIYENTKRLVKEKGYTMGEIEDMLQVSRGYFSRRKPNGSTISIDDAFDIASALEITLDELCKLPEPPHWIKDNDNDKSHKYRCSECGEAVYSPMHIPYKKYPKPYPNCPFCLTKMSEE